MFSCKLVYREESVMSRNMKFGIAAVSAFLFFIAGAATSVHAVVINSFTELALDIGPSTSAVQPGFTAMTDLTGLTVTTGGITTTITSDTANPIQFRDRLFGNITPAG